MGIIRSIRSGAGKAAFEADKLRRLNAIQSIIRSLEEEIRESTYRVGQVALELHQAGLLTQSELLQVCDHLVMLYSQKVAREQEIRAVRVEEYVEPQRETRYSRLCPNGHGELPSTAMFCPVCGSRAVDAPTPAPSSRFCPSCGMSLTADTRFCPTCGAGVPQAQPTRPAPPPPAAVREPVKAGPIVFSSLPSEKPQTLPPAVGARHCPACGTALVAEAIFCPGCGGSVADVVVPIPPLPAKPVEQELAPRSAKAEELSETRYCPTCGTALIPEAVFCPSCGEKALNTIIPPPPLRAQRIEEIPVEEVRDESALAESSTSEDSGRPDAETEEPLES